LDSTTLKNICAAIVASREFSLFAKISVSVSKKNLSAVAIVKFSPLTA
jgi:hypothetical protein